ncbi:tRNA adenosine(34) deaminase TadA [Bdellovibrio svalbardensis]|uniref:tRNA-specific adenosine deaminase n=1 Tax=Bdellovibrio svalbardensis TaxID=2972972 RepID=A0ABT6DCZ6_9BACT|nr:tRNA adenosine(34) deaminase TadA [Bdellovibrio svalbardensis]MDG0814732.1 tRNA adenosine(34) deaminase TadA [Bdellovibrio svalbardensis]
MSTEFSSPTIQLASKLDEKWMKKALKLAAKAGNKGEVPVGAVLVSPSGEVLAQASNVRETLATTLGHAELLAIHRASKKLQSWRLEDCTLYVTLEPCVMCAGAIQQARLGRVVYGATDAKAGGVESLYNILADTRLNHQVQVTRGVLAAECSKLLTDFFQHRRDEIKKEKSEKIYRPRASVIVVHKNKVLGFNAVDPHSGQKYFFMPGGGVETGESAAVAAQRETLEETGYKIRVLEETEFRRKYDFPWNGKINHCDTVFFLGVLDEEWHAPSEVQDADYHRGVQWIEGKNVDKVFAYNKDILWAAQKLMKVARKQRL